MKTTETYTLELTEGWWDSEHKSGEEALEVFKEHLRICSTCRNNGVKARVVHTITIEKIEYD
jgi:hypothetical protein